MVNVIGTLLYSKNIKIDICTSVYIDIWYFSQFDVDIDNILIPKHIDMVSIIDIWYWYNKATLDRSITQNVRCMYGILMYGI